MALLAAALLAALAVAALVFGADRPWVRRAAVALLAALPLLYAWALLAAAGERLGSLSIDEVGKRLAFGPDLPVTAGGSAPDSGRAEDLHAPRLPAAALAIRPAEDGLAFELGSPAPAVEVDGELRNQVPLAEGDAIEVDRPGGESVALTFDGGSLALADRRADLPTGWLLALRGSDRVVLLRDVLAELEAPGGARPLSFLRYEGGWRLVIRERGVSVRRPGEVARFPESFETPPRVRVRLGVVLGEPGDRELVWLRDDRLVRAGRALEVRYGRPVRHLAEVDPVEGADGPRELAIVAPGTFDRLDMIELDEPSLRFAGLAARLAASPEGAVELTFLGSRREVRPGEVYGLGEGEDDLLFLRFGRESFPWRLLLDLALLGLFLAVFLGPSLAAEPGLAAVAAPAGLLLASRLLFAWKAASRPPDFPVEALAEARLALWLVPALLLAGWSLAWALGRAHLGPEAVRWPVNGLLLAAAGCLVVGDGGERWLALLPLASAGLLAAVPWLVDRPAVAGRLERWRGGGVPWRLGWLVAAGAAILAARALFAAVGMPEALRLPGAGRVLLWTVIQLPLCAVLLALSLVVARRRLDEAAAGAAPPARWPLAVAALLVFLGLAFAAVAAVVGDLGLLLVQGLPFALALLLLVSRPRATSPRAGWAVALGLLLAVLPALAVVTVNRWPEVAVRALEGGGGDPGATVAVRDRVAELSARRAQQVFRLYLLANPSALREVGLEPSDRTAVQYETLQGYAADAGWSGGGFLSAPLPRHLGSTYLSDLVPMVFVLPELGRAGLLGLALLYLLPLGWLAVARPARGPLGEQGTMLAAVAGVVFAVPGLYMILANLNLVLFSGKNTPLLGLNSLSDAVETGLVLAVAAAGAALRRVAP